MRKLSWNALSMMDGCTVIIHDEEYDAYDQECTVIVKKRTLGILYQLHSYNI